MSLRPCLAKYFSPDTRTLLQEIQACYSHNMGPQHGPKTTTTATQRSSDTGAFTPILVPHGAYQDGGVVAAHGYRHFAEMQPDRLPSTLILIGNSHWPLSQHPPVVLCSENFQTPLGTVPIAREIFGSLAQSLLVDNAAHRREHSIENQLPFLQQLYSERKQTFSIVPILVANNGCWSRASDLNSVVEFIVEKLDLSATVSSIGLVGTTDFSHVGPFYRELPPRGQSVVEYTTRVDTQTIDELLQPCADLDQFVQTGSRTSACGIWSAALTTLLARRMREKMAVKPRDVKLLKYAVASEILENDNVTGFGAFAL